MQQLWDTVQRAYLRLVDPIADLFVRWKVSPNTITTIGTFCSIVGGVIYATGHISTAGLWLGITAFFDVLDGVVARRTGQASTFGAFYDSTLDRVADGAVLGGLTVFYAVNPVHHSLGMVIVCVAGIMGTYLTSYTRARAEALGIDAKVGLLQRPQRVVLLAAPQGLFGLALNGWVLAAIVVVLAVTSWITAWQRIAFVRRVTREADANDRRAAARPAGAELAAVAASTPPTENA
jgi:CDP-diacylglycerol--glycerol-3-phosphate 3-phosphatidyltransferase